MALVLKDRVKETTVSTGTGTITLAGAVSGFQSFSAIGNGNTTYYTIAEQSGGNWEVGIGTYTASGTTLARNTVLASSNSGSLVNFGAGTKDVFVTYPSEFSNTAQVGDVVLATEAPTGPGTWLEAGKYYSKASYPDLATKVGSIADFGDVVANPQVQIPTQFAVTTQPYLAASDGTTAVVVGTSGSIATSTNGTTWTHVGSQTTTTFNEVRYVNGNFVAVPNQNGTVSTSTNGTTWVARFLAPVNLNSVAFGNTRYVVVGASGYIAYSTDLNSWTVATVSTTQSFQRIIYANSLFVAVGGGGAVFTSSDGITWTSRSAGANAFNDVIYANSLFVAVGGSGAVYTSPDGVTWTSRSAGANSFNQVIYDNSLFVAVGNAGSIYTSTDGITWTSRTTSVSVLLASVVWNGTNFFAVSTLSYYYTSPDGITWTAVRDESLSALYAVFVFSGKTIAFGVNSCVVLAGATRSEPLQSGTWAYTISAQSTTNPRAIAYNGSNQYVVVGQIGAILTSSNGTAWAGQVSGGTATTNLDKVQYVNGNYIVMGGSGSGVNLITSSNGTTWTLRTAGTAIFNAAAFGASTYVVAGAGGAVFSSPDLVTWTTRSAGANAFNDVIFANSIFVAVGAAGACYSSSDGITWTTRSAGANAFNRIIYANSLFVAIGNVGTIYTSTNGTTWTSRTSNVSSPLNDVVWNGSIFCAVGDSGVITTSPDGVNWTARTPGDTTVALMSISWDGTRFVVSNTTNGAVWTSTDGITWIRSSTTTNNGIRYSAYLGGRFIAVANGNIQTSTDGYTWTASDNVQYVVATASKIYKLGGNYYILSTSGLFQSSDGITFSEVRQTSTSAFFVGMAYSGSEWVAVNSAISGAPTTFYRSTNGTTWVKSAQIGQLTTTATIVGSTVGLERANGNFIVAVPGSAAQQVNNTIYTSSDGITWTPRRTPFIAAASSIASDGTTAVITSGNGLFKSTDGGVTWTLVITTLNSPIIYSNGVWVINAVAAHFVSTDLITFYPTGITASGQIPGSIYVSGNYVTGAVAQNTVLFNKQGPGYSQIPNTGVSVFAYTATAQEVVVRGTTALLSITRSVATNPQAICERPLYSYDTSTTFWLPPSNAGAGQKAYVYAGA